MASPHLSLADGRARSQGIPPARVRWLLLSAIVLLAAFFRLHRIDALPPGVDYDPAFYGVDALEILQGARPIFLTTNYGREPLFSYAVAAAFLLLGASSWAIRVTSAVFGILAVPAVYFVAEELFADDDGPLGRFGGLAAALMIAVSYWHLNWSRYGVRAILVPFFAATTIALLWRGLRTGALAPFLLGGVSLGLSMYTYQVARLLPVLVLLGFAAVIRDRGAITRRDWNSFLVVATVALLVFAPLGLHFVANPDSFIHRIEDAFVVQRGESAASSLRPLLNQALDAWLAFSFVGDPTPYSTIPGRPSLNPFLSALFLIGIVVSVGKIHEPPYLFSLSWLVVMTIPAMLAELGPTAKRAIGTLPAVAVLIAVGALTPLNAFRRWLGDRSPARARWLQAAWGVLLLCGSTYTAVVTYRDYFVRWASNPNLPTHFEAGISAMGEYIGDLPPGQQVYISPEPPSHPAIRFQSGLRNAVRGYNGRVCLVVPGATATETTYVIVPGKDGRSLDLLERAFPEGTIAYRGAAERDQTHFLAYRIPAGIRADLEPTARLAAEWSDRIQFLGFSLDQDVYRAGETLELTLFYRDLAPMERRYTTFVHLLGPENPATSNPLWAQYDSEPCRGFYPTTSWHQGEVLLDRIEISVPGNAPSSTYHLGIGFYDVVSHERLPVASEAAPTDHNVLTLGEVRVTGAE